MEEKEKKMYNKVDTKLDFLKNEEKILKENLRFSFNVSLVTFGACRK